jgi:outer membrane protein assembly factor BamB
MFLTLVLLATLHAADWDRFRGPNGTGVSQSKAIPVKWGKENVLFKTPLPGSGHSSPIIVGSKVLLLSATNKERLILCFDADTGKQLWSQKIKGDVGKTHRKSSLASATPCSDGERVFCVVWDGSAVELLAFTLDGKEAWKAPLGEFKSQHGPGFSPMLVDGKVIVNNDQDGKAVLLAFDAKSGTQVWKAEREAYRASYSTPIVTQGAEGRELLVTSTAGITAYNPEDGKEVWKYVWPFGGKPLRTVGSSVIAENMVFACAGDGAGDRAMIAVKLGGKGNVTKTNLVWSLDNGTPYVPTLLAKDKHLYTLTDDGIAICREASSGKEIWRGRVTSGVSASPVMIDGKVYAFGEKGDVSVFAAVPEEFKVLAKNSIGEGIIASPAVARDRLYIRGEKSLICIGTKK